MINILFTDTHFGVKQNSITWLNSQLDFIYKQLIPYIESLDDEVRLIHLGDVFDSRSSISTMVASKVVDAFKELRSKVKKFVVIAGNHDYYSPNSSDIDTLSLILKSLDIDLITKGIHIDDDCVYVPWYSWGDEIIQDVIYQRDIKYLFTHADIVNESIKYKNVAVFSGHIHIPELKQNSYNLGSCYSINFADSNQERGFYVLKNNNLDFIPNNQSIKFWRFYNEDIFNIDSKDISEKDYIEIYLDKNNMIDDNYTRELNILTNKYKNLWIIPKSTQSNNEDYKFEGYDIKSMTLEIIPDNLKEKFNQILNKIEDHE